MTKHDRRILAIVDECIRTGKSVQATGDMVAVYREQMMKGEKGK